MPNFRFIAQHQGRSVKGVVEATDLRAARAALEREYPQILSLEAEIDAVSSWRRPSARALSVYVRQLATMLKASLTMHRSLDALTQGSDPQLNRVFKEVRDAVMSGLPLSGAMSRHADVFSPYFLTLMRSGELSGNVDGVMERLADSLERQAALRQRLISSLTYPAFSLVLAAVVLQVLIYGVIPVFQPIFTSLGVELPLLTRILLGIHAVATDWRLIMLPFLGIGLLILGVRRYAPSGFSWSRLGRKAALRLPVIGELLHKAAVANMLFALATMLDSGVMIVAALKVLEDQDKDGEINQAMGRVRDRVVQGSSVAEAMEEARVFPPLVLGMLKVGEESGHLDEMMRRTAESFELDLENAQAQLVALTEPLVMAVLGGITGFIVLAAILPIMNLLSSF